MRNNVGTLVRFVASGSRQILCLLLRPERQNRPLAYDRIEVPERFLTTVYPDLADQLAMFELDTTFEGKRGVTIRNVKFYPCRPATGVRVPTIGGVILGATASNSPSANGATPLRG